MGNADKSAKKAGGGIMGAMGKAKVPIIAAGTAAIGFGVSAVKAFGDSQKVAAQTEAVLKSTGGAAGVTADDIDKLSGAISRKSGLDDEAVASGQNMLLTFTNIKNEAGKGNDIFTQTSNIMADLSVAMGQDMKSSAIQLGKALNDPTKGVTALTRVGVTFTDAQKKSIAAMQESGNVAGAQRLILAELNKEFGGSAKAAGDTFPGQLAKLQVAFGNVQEKVGEFLVKGLMKIPDIIDDIQKFFKKHQDTLNDVKQTVEDVGKIISEVWEGLVWPIIKRVLPAIEDIVKGVFTTIKGIVETISGILTGDFGKAWEGVQGIFSGAAEILKGILRAMTAPFREIAAKIGDAIIDGIRGGLGNLFEFGKERMEAIGNGIASAVEWMKGKADNIGLAIVSGVKAGVGNLFELGRDFVERVGNGVGAMFEWITGKARDIGDHIRGAIQSFADDLYSVGKNLATSLWNGIQSLAGWLKNKIIGWAKSVLPGPIEKLLGIGSPSKLFMDIGKNVSIGLGKGILSKESFVKNAVTGLMPNGIAGPAIGGGAIGGGALTGGGSAVINNYISAMDPTGAADAVIRAIDEFERRNGRRFTRA